MNRIAHHIIEEGLSERVIVPGHTTTKDLEWWYRNRIQSLGLSAWFHPSVDVQYATREDQVGQSFASRPGEDVIMPGDGDYLLYPNTAYAIELNVTESIPEWGSMDVRIMLEENAWFDGNRVRYIDGRRTELILVPRVK